MEVRDLNADEQAACRAKGAQKVDKLLSDNKDKTAEEIYGLLHDLFQQAADKWDHTGEHFVRTSDGQLHFSPADGETLNRDEEEVVLLLKGRSCCEETMRASLRTMDELQGYGDKRLSQVNGTSVIFNRCVERLAAGPQKVREMPSNITLPPDRIPTYK